VAEAGRTPKEGCVFRTKEWTGSTATAAFYGGFEAFRVYSAWDRRRGGPKPATQNPEEPGSIQGPGGHRALLRGQVAGHALQSTDPARESGSDAVGRSIGELRQIAARLKPVFLGLSS
jgi:hypothetical protein